VIDIGVLCVDVQPSARWFSCGHSRMYYRFHLSFTAYDSIELFLKTWIFMQIFEIAKTMGWVPAVADRNKTYLHLNQRIPDELKFDLNCLLYTHGKLCSNCSSKRGNKQQKKFNDSSCPLLNYNKEPVWSLNYENLFSFNLLIPSSTRELWSSNYYIELYWLVL
jgi:hypothetical protein